MRAAEGIGKRKRAVVVSRSGRGEYSTVPSAPRPGDGHEELEAIPVPTYIDTGATRAGHRRRCPPGHPLTGPTSPPDRRGPPGWAPHYHGPPIARRPGRPRPLPGAAIPRRPPTGRSWWTRPGPAVRSRRGRAGRVPHARGHRRPGGRRRGAGPAGPPLRRGGHGLPGVPRLQPARGPPPADLGPLRGRGGALRPHAARRRCSAGSTSGSHSARLVEDVLDRGPIYRYADPFGALNLAVMAEGDELQWHFDQTDFVVSLAVQAADAGGDFEVVPEDPVGIRRALRRGRGRPGRRPVRSGHPADDPGHPPGVRGPPLAAPGESGRGDPGPPRRTARLRHGGRAPWAASCCSRAATVGP